MPCMMPPSRSEDSFCFDTEDEFDEDALRRTHQHGFLRATSIQKPLQMMCSSEWYCWWKKICTTNRKVITLFTRCLMIFCMWWSDCTVLFDHVARDVLEPWKNWLQGRKIIHAQLLTGTWEFYPNHCSHWHYPNYVRRIYQHVQYPFATCQQISSNIMYQRIIHETYVQCQHVSNIWPSYLIIYQHIYTSSNIYLHISVKYIYIYTFVYTVYTVSVYSRQLSFPGFRSSKSMRPPEVLLGEAGDVRCPQVKP